ncbi:MAG TPA: 3' terminal RNA ribose 2'-O-methyltransferase Hen1 [Herpetosiphonaceae bacterium]
MLLTITTTHVPATDLGYLLHKNPERLQTFELNGGLAHVFYPEANPDRCTAALLLEIDPVGLVRGRQGAAALEQYVNDRPYVASSFLSVAIREVFSSALAGRSKSRPELVEQPLPLAATLAAVPCAGGAELLRRLFEPLGYAVDARQHQLDERFPEWGDSRYFTLGLTGAATVHDLLSHLYVLIPVLDNRKHYWVGEEEIDKLLRHGEGWLAAHPERELITRRYLLHKRNLANQALEQLVRDEQADPDAEAARRDEEEAAIEAPARLNDQRMGAVLAALKACGAKRVLDLGCGEGQLLRILLKEPQFERILGMDVAYQVLEKAQEKLKLDRLPPMQRERIELIHGSLMYRDQRLQGYDAAAVVEVIEHLDPPRLAAFERAVFEFARPGTVVVTTPNVEYNAKFESLPAGTMRHRDHRFEWTRNEFRAWADELAARYGYAVRFLPVGPDDPIVGSPTQMGVFSRER